MKAAAKAQPKGVETAKSMPVRSPQKLLSTSASAVVRLCHSTALYSDALPHRWLVLPLVQCSAL